MEFLFWLSLLFILYTYAGFPCLLFVWSRLFPKKVNKAYPSEYPLVSVIIAARNEEKNIKGRLKDLLKQDYPLDKMEVIVVSDGSTDKTNQIVEEQAKMEAGKPDKGELGFKNLMLIEIPESRGKPNAINVGVKKASADFIVFTDARQRFEPNAVKELLANFNDPDVGCVSGELVFYEDSDTDIKAEMGFYWNLEKRVRKMESAVGSVAGATGAIYAIRKSLFSPLPEETLLDDVFIPMHVVFKGYRTVFDGEAVAYDTVSQDLAQEKRRKIRTLLGNYQLIKIMSGLLSSRKNPIFLRFLSHKILRLFVSFFFLGMLFTSLFATGITYKLAFLLCIVVLVLPLIDRAVKPIPLLGSISTLARTFVSLNYFAFLAFVYLVKPGKKGLW